MTAQGRARSKPLLGGSTSTVGDLETGGPHSISASDTVAVWASDGDGAVFSRVGAAVGTVATGLDAPTDVALDGSRVFIAVDQGPLRGPGARWQCRADRLLDHEQRDLQGA